MWTDRIPEDATIIDIRDPDSFKEYHYPGSINIPFEEMIKKVSSEELPREKNYLIVCYAGMKTSVILNMMLAHGYRAQGVIGGIGTLRRIEEEKSQKTKS